MSATLDKSPHDHRDTSHNFHQTSPLLESRGDNSTITGNACVDGSAAALRERPFLPDGPSAALSIRLGSGSSSPQLESHGYSEISLPSLAENRPKPRDPHATELKTNYQNDSMPLSSAPSKIRPLKRPPPRKVSEDSNSGMSPPPRNNLYNNNLCSPSSRTRSIYPSVSDSTTEMINNSLSAAGGTCIVRRQRRCIILAFVAIFLALSIASVAAAFSIHTYMMTRDSKQVQGNESGKTSAHVGLKRRPSMNNKISNVANETLYLANDRSKLHNILISSNRSLTIQTRGMYLVYSSVNFNTNDRAQGAVWVCGKDKYKTWVHVVKLHRKGQSDTILLKAEHTCCEGCTEIHYSTFTGGVFDLLPMDNIFVQVSAPKFVFDDERSSFLGLFLMD